MLWRQLRLEKMVVTQCPQVQVVSDLDPTKYPMIVHRATIYLVGYSSDRVKKYSTSLQHPLAI